MSVSLYSNGQLANNTRGSWIATAPFNNDFFSYTTSVNPTTFQTTGTLGAVTGATALNCPALRVLRENGKKLYPSAHNGVSTYMIGVFDPVSFLSGFIDPNSSIFAVYNTNKPASLDTTNLAFAGGINPNGGSSDLAPPIVTAGSVSASGQIRSGTAILPPQLLSANDSIAVDNTTNPGQNFTISVTNGGAVTGINFDFANPGFIGDLIRIIVTNGSANTITLADGTNSRVPPSPATAIVLAASKVSILTFISNGTYFYLESFTTNMSPT